MSTIAEKLTASKNGLTALLDYANQTTGQSDTNIGDAVKTLADGYGKGEEIQEFYIDTKLASRIEFENADFGGIDTIRLDLSNVSSMTKLFFNTKGLRRCEIKCPSYYVVDCRQLAYSSSIRNTGVSEIHFITPLYARLLNFGIFDLKKITGGIALRSDSGNNIWRMLDLEEIEFVPKHIFTSLSLYDSEKLSDNSLISIANGLVTTADGAVSTALTLHKTPKERLLTISGIINDDIFTQDDSGTITLYDFITSTKGWTLK